MAKDRDLLFGTLALQVGLIDEAQFLRACRAWLARQESSLAEILAEAGEIRPADASAVRRLAESRSADDPDLEVRRALEALGDPPFDPTETQIPEVESSEPVPGDPNSRERYTLTQLHAQGGLGKVWLAWDDSLGREVALKELRPERAEHPGIGARFLQEARVTGQLEHPNIVPVYELSRGGPSSPPFYAMRFVKGRTLAEAIRAYHRDRREGKAGPLEFRELLNALVAVGNAVAFAHARGVIHRDLKPQNVVLGDYGEVVVLDWGLAKRLGEAEPSATEFPSAVSCPGGSASSGTSTLEGQALGTPAYMPPEQAAGLAGGVDRRSDVYGLGAVLYEVLTGRPPFTDVDTAGVLRRVREQPPPWPRSVCPSADPALEAVCLKALEKAPGARYDSAPEFSAELQRWLAGEPVLAYAEPIPARVRRWVARHRTPVTAGVAAGTVALVALVVATVLLASSRNGERQARWQVEKHRRLAVAQEAKAVENLATARRVVDRYLTIISESELLTRPGLQPLREQLLREGMQYYSKFAAEHAEDPTLQADLAAARLRLGRITEEIGSKAEALDHYRKAREVLGELSEALPDDPGRLASLADCQNRLGNLEEAMGQTEEALASLQAAQGLASRLTWRFPSDARHRARLAGIENNLGNVQRAAGQTAEALASYRRAREEFGLLALATSEADEAVTGYRASVAGTDQNIGVLLREIGQLDEALVSLERATDLRRELASERPSDRLRRELAQGLNQLGLTHRELGRPDDALASHAEALAIQETLAAANPAVTDYQRDLAVSLVNLGDLASASGRVEQAISDHGRARDVFQRLADDNPGVRAYRNSLAASDHNLGIVLQEAGRPGEAKLAYHRALRTLERLTVDSPEDEPLWMDLGVVWNNLGGLERAGGRPGSALALHRKARDVFERLAAGRPNRFPYRAALAQTYNHIGLSLQDLGRRSDALGVHAKALEALESLRATNPDSAVLRRDLGVTLLNLAVIHQQAGMAELAIPRARRARGLFEDLFAAAKGSARGRRDLVSCLDLLGDLAGEAGRLAEARETLTHALELQEAAVRGKDASPDDHSLLGAVLGHLGLVLERSGDQAGALKANTRAVAQHRAARAGAPEAPSCRRLLSGLLGQLGGLQRRLGRDADADATARDRLRLASEAPPDPEAMILAAADLAMGLPDPAQDPSGSRAPWSGVDPEEARRVADAWGALRQALNAGFDDPDSLRQVPELARLFQVAEVSAWLDRVLAGRKARGNVRTRTAGQECQVPAAWNKAETRPPRNSGVAIGKETTLLDLSSPPCPIESESKGPERSGPSSSSSLGQNGKCV